MDGLILPDVPFEEKEEFDLVCRKYGLDLISLIAPTSHERIRMIAEEASGLCILRILPGRHGDERANHYGCGGNGRQVRRRKKHPLRSRIRHLHTGTGGTDEPLLRRSDLLRKRYCPNSAQNIKENACPMWRNTQRKWQRR